MGLNQSSGDEEEYDDGRNMCLMARHEVKCDEAEFMASNNATCHGI